MIATQMNLQLTESMRCNANEAPAGYRAVPKATHAPRDGVNICRACDWRKTCQDPDTDFNAHGHRCMSYSRNDGQAVLFKRVHHIPDAGKMVSLPNAKPIDRQS